MHLRRRSGRRRWRGRRLLRVSAWESVVVLARAPERLSVSVHTRHRHSGGRLQPMAVAARLARRLRERTVRRDLRCGWAGRSRLRSGRESATRDSNPCAAVYSGRVGRRFLSPRHQMHGRRSGELRGSGDLADRHRGAVLNGGRKICDHPPGRSADRGQQRRRLAPDPGALEEEHRERDPHRRNENGGEGRRQMSERLHGRVVGQWRPFAESERCFVKDSAELAILHPSCRILHATSRSWVWRSSGFRRRAEVARATVRSSNRATRGMKWS